MELGTAKPVTQFFEFLETQLPLCHGDLHLSWQEGPKTVALVGVWPSSCATGFLIVISYLLKAGRMENNSWGCFTAEENLCIAVHLLCLLKLLFWKKSFTGRSKRHWNVCFCAASFSSIIGCRALPGCLYKVAPHQWQKVNISVCKGMYVLCQPVPGVATLNYLDPKSWVVYILNLSTTK